MSWQKKVRQASHQAEHVASRWRVCRFEQMEPREMLSAAPVPIQVGMVYFEGASGDDLVGDTFTLTWNGGTQGTQLTELMIDTDKEGNGLTNGDCFFDTAAGGLGAYGAVPFQIVSSSGIDSVQATVVDGGSKLAFKFTGFDPGEKLVFTIDVDEMGFLEPNSVAEGGEFEGSKMTASFVAPHYFDAVGSDIFYDQFTSSLTASGLNLPNDDYMPPSDASRADYTAGAIFSMTQEALPITIAGNVYEDLSLDNSRQAGEPGIAGVALTLQEWNGTSYQDTGLSTLTAADGSYSFDGMGPGRYRIVETQPSGYLSVGATAGTVLGVTRGVVVSSDILGEIDLLGGEDSVQNNFAEAKPVSLSGHVYHDANNNGVFDAGEQGIGGAQILLIGPPMGTAALPPIQIITNADGSWSATGLRPGQWSVTETTPSGWIDGLDAAGNAGGTAHNPGDLIDGIYLASGQSGVNYDFGELLPGSISGRVSVDVDGDCIHQDGEPVIAGVTIQLLDAQGAILQTTTTNNQGEYQFTNLGPGVYGVHEVQPAGYIDGGDHVGTAGGALLTNDSITQISLPSGVAGEHYDFCEIPPVSVSGYVYADNNNNGVMDIGEQGIAGVVISLLGDKGLATGVTTTTDGNGFYSFSGLLPGTYGVREAQPSGWLDGLDAAGSAGGAAHNPGDQIDTIVLAGGIAAVNYNFGELKPASLTGHVHGELDRDCIHDDNEPWLAGVTIYLLDPSGNRIQTTTTNANGVYRFDNLLPGVYGIEEVTPPNYLDGSDHVGSLGGEIKQNDVISAIPVKAGDAGIDYNFCELIPSSISGYVFQDGPVIQYKQGEAVPDVTTLRTGILKPDDIRLAGVQLTLGDASGMALLDAKGNPYIVKTDANGYYEFKMLSPGTYTILETQPTGYVDGIDTAGSVGGLAINRNAKIDPLVLSSLAVDPRYDAIVRISVGAGVNAQNYNFSEVVLNSVPNTPPGPPDPPRELPNTPYQPFVSSPAPYAHYAAITVFTPPPPGMFGGSGGPGGNTWHLSVIDGGNPRRKDAGVEFAPVTAASLFKPVSWSETDLGQSQWIVADMDGKVFKTFVFGGKLGTPVAADFNGDGLAEVAVFSEGQWFIDLNGDGVWNEGDLWARLGQGTDLPVTGDWNGDGKADIGIFGPSWLGDAQAISAEPGMPSKANRTEGRLKNMPPEPRNAAMGYRTLKQNPEGRMRNDLIDHVFQFGVEGDVPLVGDWTGDGVKTIGVCRDGAFFLDIDGDGRWSPDDVLAEFGQPGDLPVVGDWTGDGITKLGVYRNGKFVLDMNNNRRIDAGDKTITLGQPGDKPVAADFNGDGIDEVAVYRQGAANVERTASRK